MLRSRVERVYAGQPLVFFGRPVAEYADALRHLKAFSTPPPYIISNDPHGRTVATGDVAGTFALDFGYLQEGLVRRTAQEALADPPAALIKALNEFDPRRRAWVLAEGISSRPTFQGRPVIDALSHGQSIVDDILRDPRLIARTTATLDRLSSAAAEIDLGYGVLGWGQEASGSVLGADCYHLSRDHDETLPTWMPQQLNLTPHLDRPVLAATAFCLPDGVVHCGLDRLWCATTSQGGPITAFPGCVTRDAPVRASAERVVRTVGAALRVRRFVGPFTVVGYEIAGAFRAVTVSVGSTENHARIGAELDIPWILLSGALMTGTVPAPTFAAELAASAPEQASIAKLNVTTGPVRPRLARLDNGQQVIWARAPEGGVLVVRAFGAAALRSPIPSFQEGLRRWELPDPSLLAL